MKEQNSEQLRDDLTGTQVGLEYRYQGIHHAHLSQFAAQGLFFGFARGSKVEREVGASTTNR